MIESVAMSGSCPGKDALGMSVQAVSVFVPAFNAERWIDDCIRSVLNQTLRNFVLIIIDDGSHDGTAERVRAYTGDARVRLISDGENRGLVARLNQSIQLCTTPYYARMDADDVMHPERLERQIAELEARPEAAFCATGVCLIDENAQILGVRRAACPSARTALSSGALVHPTLLARTAFMQDNLYDAAYERTEDRELFVRKRNWERGIYLADPLLYYRRPQVDKLDGLLTGYRMERRIIAEHGPALLGYAGTMSALLLSWAKQCYVSARGVTHSGVFRGLESSPALLHDCREALGLALATSVARK